MCLVEVPIAEWVVLEGVLSKADSIIAGQFENSEGCC